MKPSLSVNPLIEIVIRFCGSDPVGAAHAIETLDEDTAAGLMEAIPRRELKKVLPLLSPTLISAIVEELPPTRVARLLENAGAESCSAALLSLAEERREGFLAALPEELREQMRELLTFPESSVGQIMRTDYTAFSETLTVREAIARLRRRSRKNRNPSNIFVVGPESHLIGVISVRDLIVADDDARLSALMVTDVMSVGPFDEEGTALRTLSGQGFTTLPVIDAQGRLIGVVRATQLLADARMSASKDLQKLFGAGRDERAFSPVGFCLRKRLPWLHINLATAFLAAAVVAMFEDVIAKVTVLAIYLPVVAGQGGNAGAQSLAVVMRGLVMREIPDAQTKRLLIKESSIGVVNGIVLGLVTAAIAWAWNGNPYLGVVIGLAMIVNLAVAGLAGAAIPLMMRKFGLDPAQSSSIVLTTVTDVVGFFSFLGIAVLMQDLLI